MTWTLTLTSWPCDELTGAYTDRLKDGRTERQTDRRLVGRTDAVLWTEDGYSRLELITVLVRTCADVSRAGLVVGRDDVSVRLIAVVVTTVKTFESSPWAETAEWAVTTTWRTGRLGLMSRAKHLLRLATIVQTISPSTPGAADLYLNYIYLLVIHNNRKTWSKMIFENN